MRSRNATDHLRYANIDDSRQPSAILTMPSRDTNVTAIDPKNLAEEE